EGGDSRGRDPEVRRARLGLAVTVRDDDVPGPRTRSPDEPVRRLDPRPGEAGDGDAVAGRPEDEKGEAGKEGGESAPTLSLEEVRDGDGGDGQVERPGH